MLIPEGSVSPWVTRDKRTLWPWHCWHRWPKSKHSSHRVMFCFFLNLMLKIADENRPPRRNGLTAEGGLPAPVVRRVALRALRPGTKEKKESANSRKLSALHKRRNLFRKNTNWRIGLIALNFLTRGTCHCDTSHLHAQNKQKKKHQADTRLTPSDYLKVYILESQRFSIVYLTQQRDNGTPFPSLIL